MSEILLHGTIHDIPVDHSSTEKEDILNIHKYITKKAI